MFNSYPLNCLNKCVEEIKWQITKNHSTGSTNDVRTKRIIELDVFGGRGPKRGAGVPTLSIWSYPGGDRVEHIARYVSM